jgi:UDP-N-acetylglucosamine 1-carboxyvinyltransferase
MSQVDEVIKLVKLFETIGVKCRWEGENYLEIDASGRLQMDKIDKKLCSAMRISLLFFGALAAREKSYKVYKSGGCKLGARSVRPHTLALEKFGVDVESKSEYYEVQNAPLKAAYVVMYESGDTTTENAVMAAVLAPGYTTIKMASANYQIQDLCHFLIKAGAKIKGVGTTTLQIEGVKELKAVKNYEIIPDPVDAMAWIALALTTHSAITVKNCALEFLELELEKLRVMGQKFRLINLRKQGTGKFDVADIVLEPSKLIALPDKVYGRPFPGLNIDNLPFFVPISTQAKGKTMVHDWAYENRALYGLEFQKLGANVMLMDPHRLLVEGPAKLVGGEAVCPPAIRPGMAILIAMIAAKGNSILRNVSPIERAYEHLIDRLRGLGVKIDRFE